MMSRVREYLAAALLLFGAAASQDAFGQCILANPSFEVSGSGGQTFGGWNQFGLVGSSTDATHGAAAARLSGPDLGGWDVSGYWQRLDSAPGEQWVASVIGWHSSANPLTGESRAILNIEWHNAVGDQIGFESHTVADASTPPDQRVPFSVQSQPAPTGTVATHFLLGVLQSPAEPPPDVFYDESTFESLGPPTADELQWLDFPGGRTMDFSGRTWRVKGPGFYGPGPSLFCDTASCTWVDRNDRLHLTIQNISGSWYSTEVTLQDALGYGDYVFTTMGRIDTLHANVVLGMFLWQYPPCFEAENGWWNPYNEIDVEISRWGNPGNDVAQFVVQPWDFPGNVNRFDAAFSDGELSSYAFLWLPDRIEFRSWRGGPQDEAPENLIHSWTYTGSHLPRLEQPRVHLNLWQFNDPPAADQEVVFDGFQFTPHPGAVGAPVPPSPVSAVAHLAPPRPNPFTHGTTIGYNVVKQGDAEVVVYDVTGRVVRTLVNRFVSAGRHEIAWNGRDGAGDRVASGVYLVQLRVGDVVETRRVVLLR
jgi:hypothetical protein